MKHLFSRRRSQLCVSLDRGRRGVLAQKTISFSPGKPNYKTRTLQWGKLIQVLVDNSILPVPTKDSTLDPEVSSGNKLYHFSLHMLCINGLNVAMGNSTTKFLNHELVKKAT